MCEAGARHDTGGCRDPHHARVPEAASQRQRAEGTPRTHHRAADPDAARPALRERRLDVQRAAAERA